jgi:SAM-dependent methyltransferase
MTADRHAPGWRWQDAAAGGGLMDEIHPQRRVIGVHDVRFDGLSDLLLRAHGCSVMDIGCNRGHIGYEFAVNGARLVHGCDIYGPGIAAARHWFAELPHVTSQFEVVNLEEGPAALTNAFGPDGYDIMLFIGVVHKLKRVMQPQPLAELIRHLGERALTYFAWNGYAEDLVLMDQELAAVGLRRVHTSELALPGRPAAIWRR